MPAKTGRICRIVRSRQQCFGWSLVGITDCHKAATLFLIASGDMHRRFSPTARILSRRQDACSPSPDVLPEASKKLTDGTALVGSHSRRAGVPGMALSRRNLCAVGIMCRLNVSERYAHLPECVNISQRRDNITKKSWCPTVSREVDLAAAVTLGSPEWIVSRDDG